MRAALAYKLQQAHRDLNNFLEYIEHHTPSLPILAQVALDWAWSGQYAADVQVGRLSRVHGFLYYLRGWESQTEVPEFGLIAAP